MQSQDVDTEKELSADREKVAKQRELEEKISAGNAKDAVAILKDNMAVEINMEQAVRLLDLIPLDLSAETENEQQVLTSVAYTGLKNRGLLRGFGCVQASPQYLPYPAKEIDVEALQETIALPMSALTPKNSQYGWLAAGLGLCTVEYLLAANAGLDPLRTVIPFTAFLFVLDRVLTSGAAFESVYRFLFPKYKEKVIKHEAGHFLLAYLLGCPIQGFFLSAWDATRAGIRGQAGTVFFDNDLSSQLNSNRVTRTAIDRYTIVLMGGIAAEAMNYEQAEGGASDESALVSFLVGLLPPWQPQQVLNQARWAVTEAILLLREHRAAYDSLCDAMTRGESLGTCISVLDKALMEFDELPVEKRARERGPLFERANPIEGKEASIKEMDGKIAEKEAKLLQLQREEEEIRARIRELDREGSKPEMKDSMWDKSETERFMSTLLKAHRKQMAKTSTKSVDALLAEAERNRRLAEIDLSLKKLDVDLEEVRAKIAQIENAR